MTDEIRAQLIRDGWVEALYGYWKSPDGLFVHRLAVVAMLEDKASTTKVEPVADDFGGAL